MLWILGIVAGLYVVSQQFLKYRPPTILLWLAGSGLILLEFALCVVRVYPAIERTNWDYDIFYRIGRTVADGQDPYSPELWYKSPALNPPSSLPLFFLMGLPSLNTSKWIWITLNELMGLTIVPLSVLVFRLTSADRSRQQLSRSDVLLLTACFITTRSFFQLRNTGQVSMLAATCLVAALLARERTRPIIAGVWLSLATIKINTMLPFLLLFNKRKDIISWISLSLSVGLLLILPGHLDRLPSQLVHCLGYIKEFSQPGGINDYTDEGPISNSHISVTRAVYGLGMTDRSSMEAIQTSVILLAFLFILFGIYWEQWPIGLLSAQVALFSMIFLYHRSYDMVLLAFPLVYAARETLNQTGRGKACFFLASVLLILALNFRHYLTEAVSLPLLKGLFMGYPVWFILVTMGLLYAGQKLSSNSRFTTQTGELLPVIP